jgi:HD-GYP domain-containing protein (c-di-GMP phosphodiesterase class II)
VKGGLSKQKRKEFLSAEFKEREEMFLQLKETQSEIISKLADSNFRAKLQIKAIKSLMLAVEANDPSTYGHSERVSQCNADGGFLELPAREKSVLKYLSLLHDIGEIGIRKEILTKTTPLTRKNGR